jgi:hypothetical protein
MVGSTQRCEWPKKKEPGTNPETPCLYGRIRLSIRNAGAWGWHEAWDYPYHVLNEMRRCEQWR